MCDVKTGVRASARMVYSTENSDVDFIVRFDPDRSLFDHGELLMDLRDLLGVKVDVISEAGMRERFRKHVLREAIKL